jgi:hypothetical protein
LKDYLIEEVNRLVGREEKLEDQFKAIINKLKSLEQFKIDNNYWLEYEKLDYESLGIPNLDEFKNRFKDIFDNKTWYDLLELNFDYYSIDELKNIIMSNGLDIVKTDIRIPKYPNEYYRLLGWVSFENLLINDDIFF